MVPVACVLPGCGDRYSDIVTLEALRNRAGTNPRLMARGTCISWIGTILRMGRLVSLDRGFRR